MNKFIKHSFNKAAFSYDAHSHLQKTVGLKLIALVKMLQTTFPRIMDLGCGTGFTTRELAKTLHYRTLHALDLSDQSLAIAKKHLPDETIFIEDSFDHLQYDNSFDLLFANMSLHWSVDFTRCLSQLKTALCDSGLLALTIPLTNTFHELKEHFSIRSFLDKEIVLQQLTSLGYEIMLHEAEEIILSFATLKLALESIKKTGTNSVTRTKKTSPKKLIPLLKTASSLTYHVGYFIVKKDPSYVS